MSSPGSPWTKLVDDIEYLNILVGSHRLLQDSQCMAYLFRDIFVDIEFHAASRFMN